MKKIKTKFKDVKASALVSDRELLNVKDNLPRFSPVEKSHEKIMVVLTTLDSTVPGKLLNVFQIAELAEVFDIDETRKSIQRSRKELVRTFGKCLYNMPKIGYKIANSIEALEEFTKGINRGSSYFNNTRNAYHNSSYTYNNLTKQQIKDRKMVELLTEIVDVICNHQGKEMIEAMSRMKDDFGNKLTREKKKKESESCNFLEIISKNKAR